MSNIIATIMNSVRHAHRTITPYPVRECYLGDEEYDAVMRYADEQDGWIPPHHRSALDWHVTVAGVRIRHLRELKAANQTAVS
jgi:hypothetical protein